MFNPSKRIIYNMNNFDTEPVTVLKEIIPLPAHLKSNKTAESLFLMQVSFLRTRTQQRLLRLSRWYMIM